MHLVSFNPVSGFHLCLPPFSLQCHHNYVMEVDWAMMSWLRLDLLCQSCPCSEGDQWLCLGSGGLQELSLCSFYLYVF